MATNGPRFCLMFFLSLSLGLPRCSGPNKSSPGWAMHSLGTPRRAGFTPTTLTQSLINSLIQNCCGFTWSPAGRWPHPHICMYTTATAGSRLNKIKLIKLQSTSKVLKKISPGKDFYYLCTSFKHKPKRVGECKDSFILKHPSVLVSNRLFERWHEKEQNKCYYLLRILLILDMKWHQKNSLCNVH